MSPFRAAELLGDERSRFTYENSICNLALVAGFGMPLALWMQLMRFFTRTARQLSGRFSKIKHFRGCAAHYDELAGNYLGFTKLVCALKWRGCASVLTGTGKLHPYRLSVCG